MNAIIFEYASGGGFQGLNIPHNILCEGYSMLKTAIADFQSADYEVTTFIDSRIGKFQNHLNADETVKVSDTYSVRMALDDKLKSADVYLIIAPETRGILSNLIKSTKAGATSLNSASESIDLVSDKAKLALTLKRNGVPTPETRCISMEEGVEGAAKIAKEMSGAVVVKPPDGVGCDSIFFAKNSEAVKLAVEMNLNNNQTGRCIIQKFIEGISASVSLISNGEEAWPISLNLQQVSLNSFPTPSCYEGGIVPLTHPQKLEAFRLAKRSVELFYGLRGYIGVDLVLSAEGPIILEINPRITTSYVGLKSVSETNLAEVMVNAAKGEAIPTVYPLHGVSCFSKTLSTKTKIIEGNLQIMCPTLSVDAEYLKNIFLLAKVSNETEARKILADLERSKYFTDMANIP